jgi:hypothetical protein
MLLSIQQASYHTHRTAILMRFDLDLEHPKQSPSDASRITRPPFSTPRLQRERVDRLKPRLASPDPEQERDRERVLSRTGEQENKAENKAAPTENKAKSLRTPRTTSPNGGNGMEAPIRKTKLFGGNKGASAFGRRIPNWAVTRFRTAPATPRLCTTPSIKYMDKDELNGRR